MAPKETFAAYITIDGHVFYNRELSANAKLLYGLLSAMCQAPNYYAYARNDTLQTYLGCSERSLQRYLGELTSAHEIEIQDGEGGSLLRKIFLARLHPQYPDKSDGGTPDKIDGVVYNDRIPEKKESKKKKRNAMTQEQLHEWFVSWLDSYPWAAVADSLESEQRKLLKDLDALSNNRRAIGKPIASVDAASQLMSRLVQQTDGFYPKIPAMRYLLQESVSKNWLSVFGIKDPDDFHRWQSAENGERSANPKAYAVAEPEGVEEW